jgi:hypothetical protein
MDVLLDDLKSHARANPQPKLLPPPPAAPPPVAGRPVTGAALTAGDETIRSLVRP